MNVYHDIGFAHPISNQFPACNVTQTEIYVKFYNFRNPRKILQQENDLWQN